MSIMEAPLTSTDGEQLPAATQVPVNQQLQRNPQLPQHPLGAYTDAQYEAQNAALRSNIAKQYADVLQQLGHIDPVTGQFIMGSVETDANRQRSLLNRQMGLAREDVTHQHQQLGTLFSGLRGTEQARAEFPYTDQLGQLDINTPLALSKLYEQAAGLTSDYTIQDNQALADAAARQAAGLAQTGFGGASGTGTETPTPPPGPTDTGGFTLPGSLDARDNLTMPDPNSPVNIPTGSFTAGALATDAGATARSLASASPATFATAPTAPAVGDTSGVSAAARRKLMQWG